MTPVGVGIEIGSAGSGVKWPPRKIESCAGFQPSAGTTCVAVEQQVGAGCCDVPRASRAEDRLLRPTRPERTQ
jgi:hypothetical protein